MTRWWAGSWLDEARRATVALTVSGVVGVVLGLARGRRATEAPVLLDNVILSLTSFLLVYVVLTVVVFARTPPEQVRDWARRESRGTWLQRYVMGTAPGPGLSIFVSAMSLAVSVLWLPRDGGATTALPAGLQVAAAVIVLVLAWLSTVVSFSVAYLADDALEGGRALQFAGTAEPTWSDYLYFAVAVATSFGATDVAVASTTVRKQVTVNSVVAFVFNTVILGTVISLLAA